MIDASPLEKLQGSDQIDLSCGSLFPDATSRSQAKPIVPPGLFDNSKFRDPELSGVMIGNFDTDNCVSFACL
jgi:hypothetical protein